MIKGCIFDLDGTLLDSMHVWDDFAFTYLKHKGITTEENLDEIFSTLRMEEAITYLQKHYVPQESIETVRDEVYALLKKRYINMELKPGVKDCIHTLSKLPLCLCVLSANHRDVCKTALKKHGLLDQFTYILSCEDIHLSKDDPACFDYACEKMKVKPTECIVIEDAYHAIQGAKQAGCYVVAVKEKSQIKDEEEIKKTADAYIEDMQELEDILCRKF